MNFEYAFYTISAYNNNTDNNRAYKLFLSQKKNSEDSSLIMKT